MARTAQLGLPLVMPAQAQKHVIVNEAFALLDAVTQLRLASVAQTVPPAAPNTGDTYFIPEGAEGEWALHAGQLATYVNASWAFLQPRLGWQAWIESERRFRRFDGTEWVADAVAVAEGGSAMRWLISEFDHVIEPGSSNLTAFSVPINAVVLGVVGRVIHSMDDGSLSSWRLGVQGADDRYGSGLGIAEGAYAHGMTGTPMTYYEPTPLLLSAEGGVFTSGKVRLAVAFAELVVPRAA